MALLLWFTAALAQAQWSVTSSQSEFSNGRRVEHRHIVATSPGGDEATLDVAMFSSKTATLRVIDDPSSSSELSEIAPRNSGVAGVNGGYFDPQHAPVGLLISDGRVVAPQQKARLLSGVVSVANGRLQVQRAAEFSLKSKPTAARQCGPFLVEGGGAIPGLNNEREARRTFVLTASGDRAAIGFSSHLTLAALGELLATPSVLGDAKVQRALNLDGGSSSGFWFAGDRGAFSISEQKTVRDYLIVVPK
ncbi:MAG: phosphodiester glycosidase family protein [Chthoniobacterales bacterium]